MAAGKTLSKQAFQRASDFVRKQGRALDKAAFAYHMAGGSAAAVVAELRAYQGADGGFFRLEPDMRTSASTGIATGVATQYLRAVRAQASDPLVQRTLAYLAASFDSSALAWTAAGPAVNDAPHAPWWDYDAAAKATKAGSDANPSAELAAAFLRFRPTPAPAWLGALVARLLTRLTAAAAPLEMHDFLCYHHLHAELPASPARTALAARLAADAPKIVATDPKDWEGYGVKPLLLAPTPASPAYPALADAVARQLDWELDQQQDDGSWAPNWSWFGAYPGAWPEAEREWRGFLTVRMLKCFRDFERLGEGL